MQIYLEVAGNPFYFSYHAPAIPRVGEEICFERPGEDKFYYLKVKGISHYTDGKNYEVTLKCSKIKGKK